MSVAVRNPFAVMYKRGGGHVVAGCSTMRLSLGNRLRLGARGAPAGVLGSGVAGPRRNQLLIAQIMKILETEKRRRGERDGENRRN